MKEPALMAYSEVLPRPIDGRDDAFLVEAADVGGLADSPRAREQLDVR